jgi:hypothetical protein
LSDFSSFWLGNVHFYADDDKSRWIREFTRESKKRSAWPYTNFIERTGEAMWCLHVLGPALSGVLLVMSFFLGGDTSNSTKRGFHVRRKRSRSDRTAAPCSNHGIRYWVSGAGRRWR